jgi:predicted ATPase
MITRLTIKNFKGFKETHIELEDHLVFIGANNSGKSTAIQAISLWRQATTKWLEKRLLTKAKGKLRTGVTIARSDLTVLPLNDMRQMWHDCRVQNEKSKKVNVELILEGDENGKKWSFGMELEYQGAEQLYCRPVKSNDSKAGMPIPDHWMPSSANKETPNPSDIGPKILLLPALAGLRRQEERINDNTLNTWISQGRAGEILRNLLLRVAERSAEEWEKLANKIEKQFQVELVKPVFQSTGEIQVEFHTGLRPNKDSKKNPHPRLDIAMGGSGFHQTLLILAFLYDQPGGVLLFDEPDAHLEVIRQREIYQMLRETAEERQAQLIVCSHSEKILDEVSFENIRAFYPGEASPVPLAGPNQVSHLRKALMEVSSADFYYARLCKKVLYVEDYTDLAILKAWAGVLELPEVTHYLEKPFVHYVGNDLAKARKHFHALLPAIPALRGFVLMDRCEEKKLGSDPHLKEHMWARREIENYLIVPDAILRWCRKHAPMGELFNYKEVNEAETLLTRRIAPEAYENPLGTNPLLQDTKGSDGFLVPFFEDYHQTIKRYNAMPKNRLHELASVMTADEIHPEVKAVLISLKEHFLLKQP